MRLLQQALILHFALAFGMAGALGCGSGGGGERLPNPPAILIQPTDQSVLAGATATFTVSVAGSAPMAYQWRRDNADLAGAAGPAYSTAATSLADHGARFTVIVSNPAGSIASNPATLTVEAAPVFSADPASVTVLSGSPVAFTCVATGNPAPEYQWYRDGLPVPGATASRLALAAVSPADAGSYTARAGNALGSALSATALLVVQVPAAILAQPADQSVYVGARATFRVAATGNPAPRFQWRRAGGDLAGATGSSYTTPAAELADDLTPFTVLVSNGLGAALLSNPALLHVAPPPTAPGFGQQPLSQTVLAGAAASFTVTVSGIPAPTLQWRKDGLAIPGADGITYGIPAASPGDAGSYSAVANNSQGEATSSAATLTVNYAPIITAQPQPRAANQGSRVTFSVTATAVPPIGGYQWRCNGINLPGSTGPSCTLAAMTAGAAGSYDVLVSNSIGSTTSAPAILTMTPYHALAGRIVHSSTGQGIPGVTLTLASPARSSLSDSDGRFLLDGLDSGSYLLTPSLPGASALFLPAIRAVTVAATDQDALLFQAAVGYPVSGTVSYGGARSGRIYLRLEPAGGGDPPGCSLAGPGAFSIRGVPPGSYTLRGWLDHLGLAAANAASPLGAVASVQVGYGPKTGLELVLNDPAPVDLTGTAGPGILAVAPCNGGAAVTFAAPLDLAGAPTADSFLLEASLSAVFAGIVASATIPARETGPQTCLLSGLSEGQNCYFRVTARAEASHSNPGAAAGPYAIGAGTGGNSVSGTVSFTGAATGPLVVGLVELASGRIRLLSIPAPVSPQPFTLAGIPFGLQAFTVFLDQNGNGLLDPGDPANSRGELVAPIMVGGNLNGQALVLQDAGALASVTSSHLNLAGSDAYAESYGLRFRVDGNTRLPVNVTLQLSSALLDLGRAGTAQGFVYGLNLGGIRPQPGDTFLARIGYGDGASEQVPVTVNAVLSNFPGNLAPVTGSSVSLTPFFTWSAPVPAPAFPYSYRFWIGPKAGGPGLWSLGNLSPGTASLPFNVDGSAAAAALTAGTSYFWGLAVVDGSGNSAQQVVEYKP